MAILCSNIDEFGELVYEMHDIIKNQGVQALKDYSSYFDSLKSHWMGSDADKNIEDLKLIYKELSTMITKLDNSILEVYNLIVIPLVELLVSSGYDVCLRTSVNEKLDLKPELNFTSLNGKVYVDEKMIDDVANFMNIPKQFELFLYMLNDKKENLYLNWVEGAGVDEFKASFITFNNDVMECLARLNTTLENMNLVASLKKKIMSSGKTQINLTFIPGDFNI